MKSQKIQVSLNLESSVKGNAKKKYILTVNKEIINSLDDFLDLGRTIGLLIYSQHNVLTIPSSTETNSS